MTWVIHCYAVLAIVSNSYPPLQGRLPTRYSPVRNSSKKSKLLSSAFYLHVLGTPPAFVLSQDQTLIMICLNDHTVIKLIKINFASYCLHVFVSINWNVLHIGSFACFVQFSKVYRAVLATFISYQSDVWLSTLFLKVFFTRCFSTS